MYLDVLRQCGGPRQKVGKFFEKKIEVEKSEKCAQGHRNHKANQCIKASQARNGPDPGIMAKRRVDGDLASRLASEEFTLWTPFPTALWL